MVAARGLGKTTLALRTTEPTLAKLVAEFFAKTSATTARDPYLAKADNQLWTALHKAYVKTGVVRATVEPVLDKLVPTQADRDEIFADWDAERLIQSAAAPPVA